MPRCQWCRQESQDPNICDWCKRPLAAGWTPAATSAAALPADRMSFAQNDEPSSDRLLMFSVLGIVVLVGIAFLYSMLTRHQALPSVQPAEPQQIAQQTPGPSDPPPTRQPAVQQPEQDYTPVQQQPVYEAPAAVPQPSSPPEPTPYVRTTGNRKLDGMRDVVGVTN